MSVLFYFGLVTFPTFYYRLGDQEYDRGVLLGGISALLGIATVAYLGWGFLASVFAQVGIYVVLTAINMLRPPRERTR